MRYLYEIAFAAIVSCKEITSKKIYIIIERIIGNITAASKVKEALREQYKI